MSFDAFKQEPWKTSHDAYDSAPFNIRPAPEFATGEVMLASVFRTIGFGVLENEIPAEGRQFAKDALSEAKHKKLGTATKVSLDTWRTVLNGILESPKQPNQSAKRFLQLTPIIPDVGLYSGTARNSNGSWRPATLVERMFQFGAPSPDDAERLWKKTFAQLSITDSDDIWARWLDEEFQARRKGANWQLRTFERGSDLPLEDKKLLRFPARQFVRDFEAVLDAKLAMTRRQWTTLLESVLRLGSVTHVLWLCQANRRLWKAVEAALRGDPVHPQAAQRAMDQEGSVLAYGNPAAAQVRDIASSYLVARLGLNATLWALAARGHLTASLGSLSQIQSFLNLVSTHRSTIQPEVRGVMDYLQGEHARTINCKKGIGSNLTEFARHVLGQRQTASETLRGYDQGYLLRKKGQHSSAPWIVSLGPVAILALVHCCLQGAVGPRSIQRLSQHLGTYGLAVDRDDIAGSELGRKLRMLGLVLDSPDAESGMLLVPPFELGAEVGRGV